MPDKIEVHVHVHLPGLEQIMADLTELTAAVERDTTVTESAVTLLTELSALIRAAADDPAEIAAIADRIDANTDALAAAVTDNTPAEEPPPSE